MSKHERRAPRQSQLKLKVEGKDSAVQMARTGVLLAPKQEVPPQMARTDLPRVSMFSRWRQISNSNRMRNICRNGARSEADRPRTVRGIGASSPLSFFVAVGAIFFFNAPFLLAVETLPIDRWHDRTTGEDLGTYAMSMHTLAIDRDSR